MDSTIVTVLANAGVAGIVVILMILGFLIPKPTYTRLEAENKSLRDALQLERRRADEASEAGRVTNQLIAAVASLAAQGGYHPAPPAPAEGGPPA